MKNRLLYILTTVCLLWAGGCNDFLDEDPDNRAKVETPEDVQELLVNAYPQATYHLICEMMSDNVRDRGFGVDCVTAITDDEMYNWKDGTDSDHDSPFAVWAGLYEGISSANYAIRVMESKPDRESYRPMMGEALLCRALNHFILVNLWAEHYDPSTASTALGIPYVTEPETQAVKEYTRNTMEETYRMIEEDIRRGIQMIDDKVYSQPKFHFTRRAAHAFAARFYTYKGTEWEKVLYHAMQAVPEDFTTEVRNVSAERGGTPLEYGMAYTDPGHSTILLSVCVPTYYNDIYLRCPVMSSRYVLTPQLQYDLFNNRFHQGTWAYRIEGLTGTTVSHMMKNYAYFKSVSATSSTGMTYVNEPMFTVEDVVLNRMEAYVMLGDTTQFLRDMNRFLQTRTYNYNPRNHTVTMKGSGDRNNSILNYFNEGSWPERRLEPHYKAELEADECKMAGMMAIAMVRHLEFMQEGLRWFDIKRHHLPVEHWRHWERDYVTLDRYDKRRALQIPQEAQKVGVVPNER